MASIKDLRFDKTTCTKASELRRQEWKLLVAALLEDGIFADTWQTAICS